MKKIDPNWTSRYGRWLFVGLFAIVLAVLAATFLRGYFKLGQDAKNDSYTPSVNDGFIRKSNELLLSLVTEGNRNDIHPRSMQELNAKYPALRFELPYHEDSIAASGRAADLRLVDIIADSIHDEELKRFYLNSNLPSLLKKQRDTMGEQMFTISFGPGDYTWISGIRMIPSLFRISFVKDPWTGVIMATENAIIGERNHCFISWGKSMMPLRMAPVPIVRDNNYYTTITADVATQTFLGRGGRAVDYYTTSQDYDEGRTLLHVNLCGSALHLAYPDRRHLAIKTTDTLSCLVYDTTGKRVEVLPSEAGGPLARVAFDEDLKLVVVNRNDNSKVAEFTVSHRNPALTLSKLVNSNEGRERYNINPTLVDRFTRQVMYGLSSTLRNTDFHDTVKLTLDPLLSRELERMLEARYDSLRGRYPKSHFELSMTVIDMATGNVIAAPFYRSIDSELPEDVALGMKSPTLIRRYVGSAFKPLLALAAVEAMPSLLDLNTVGHYNNDSVFYDWTVGKKWNGNWNGCSSFSHFLGVSDDVYPVALAVLAMQGNALPPGYRAGDSHFEHSSLFHRGWRLSKKTSNSGVFTNTPLVRNISLLYDVKDNVDTYAVDSLCMTRYIWNRLGLADTLRFGLDLVRPDVTNMHYDYFFGSSLHGELVPWVLGQGNNYWAPMKFAEAWTRMLTKREVNISIVKAAHAPVARPLVDALGTQHAGATWNAFLDRLAEAQQVDGGGRGTLHPMWETVNTFNQHITDPSRRLVLLSKTGTPVNYWMNERGAIDRTSQYVDVAVYCMGLMTQRQFSRVKSGGHPRGVMCVIQLVRINPSDDGDNGLWSSDARDIFSRFPDNFDRFYQLTKAYY